MKSLLLAILVSVLIFAVVTAGVCVTMFIFEKSKCQEQAEGLRLKWEYSFVGQCRVYLDGKLVPLSLIQFYVDPNEKTKIVINTEAR